MKDRVLRVRRPNPTAPRPYDMVPMPALDSPQITGQGLNYRVFEIKTSWVPAIETIEVDPVNTGISESCDLEMATKENDNKIVIEYSGMLKVPETGKYIFTLKTGGGALLRIHDAAVIDTGKGYKPGTSIPSSIILEEGYHPIQLIDARGEEGTPFLELKWSGPEFSQKLVEPEHYVHQKNNFTAYPNIKFL